MKAMRCAAATAASLLILSGIVGLTVMYSGIYDVAATQQHGWTMGWVLHETALHSIDRRARDIKVPDLSNQGMITRGLQLFGGNCVQCHGGPGEPPHDFAKGLTPGAPRLVQVGRNWTARNIYWTITHGIKMTAMPAWEFRMTKQDIWSLVAFIRTLPRLSPDAYKAMAAQAGEPKTPAADETPASLRANAPADKRHGKLAIEQYACAACHVIPGIVAPKAVVGPPLTGIGRRIYLAGVLANTPLDMVRWIRHPQQVKPGDAMPNMQVTAADARDMAAYLESLR